MLVQLPAGVEVDVDDVAIAVRLEGRTVLEVVEHEAVEIAAALAAAGQVLALRRAGGGGADQARELVA